MMQEVPIVAIDGPSGAGKGTICRLLADQLGFQLLDSGALYRLTALAAMDASVDLVDEPEVAKVAAGLAVRFEVKDQGIITWLNDRDVSQAIREERIGMAASQVAPLQSVRAALLERQRQFAQAPGLVADGRDMGTVVFPCAKVKVFLTASAEERARRRVLQIEASGIDADYDAILKDIKARDDRDMNRAAAPLKPADDAVEIDSTEMPIETVLKAVLDLVNNIYPCNP